MNKISIKFTVVSLFLFLSALIVTSMLYVQHTFSQELMQRSINDQVKLLSSKVEDNINYMNKVNSNTIVNVSNFLQDKTIDDFLNEKKKYLELFSSILTSNKNIYATYVGFEGDAFFELINLDIDKKLRKKYTANSSHKWLLVEIVNGIKQLILLDKNLEETSKITLETDYLSTTRPWYIKSVSQKKVIKTKPYNFSNIDGKGVTYAKNIPSSKNVFALDLLINNLNHILKENGGKILENSYLFDNKGSLLASSSGQNRSVMIDKITQLIKNKKIDNHILQEITINNKKYIFSLLPMNDGFICSYSDLNKIIEPYKEKVNDMMLIIVLILLAIIPLIFYFSSIIVKPILLLTKESIKVKNREFMYVEKVNSRVLEIDQLSDSLKEMSESICEYQTDLERKVYTRTLELAEKNKELEKLSVTDKLTGLYNRIKLDETLDLAIERVNRYDEIFGIIIIDIDFFKSVNDTHGHQAGDTILVEFASLVQQYVRKTDLVGRWGGEEFMIICSETSLENILLFANKIRVAIDTFDFSIVKHKTASFGVSTYQKGETLEKMIDRADQALYIAKENGRNRVETIENSI